MLNSEQNFRTSGEALTQIAQYFDVVDNCIALSDTNKQYTINPQTSYSPSPPIQSGSFTSVIISPTSQNTADLYNGFIKAELEATIKIKNDIAFSDTNIIADTETKGTYFDKVWFGFKDARDAVEKYEIVSNGISIYTQNFAIEESFLTSCCDNELIKRSDVYSKARHKDVWNGRNNNKCGVEVEWHELTVKADGTYTPTFITEKKIKIPLKIDIKRFLPLSNIKYLPAFAGKLELRLYFSCAGMVCCPVGPDMNLRNNPNEFAKINFQKITTEFVQIGEPITCWTNKENSSDVETKGTIITIQSSERTFLVSDYKVTDCLSIIPCFGIENNVYNMLVQRYSNPSNPLTFPTQTLACYTTTKSLKNDSDKTTITLTPRFVDSIFCLFPLKHTHHTVFKNPLFKSFTLNCGAFGNIPAKPFGTDGLYPEFIEYAQNAMNMNSTQSGFNKEVVASLTNNDKYFDNTGLYSNDRTNFFIGLATETDNTFQQGLTSLSPINFEMNITQNTGAGTFADKVDTPPLLCVLFDSSISILVQQNGQPPLVRLGSYDLTSRE